jgi:D-aminopeptidase
MIVRGCRKNPFVLVVGLVIIVASLVLIGFHHRSANVVDPPAPLHDQK